MAGSASSDRLDCVSAGWRGVAWRGRGFAVCGSCGLRSLRAWLAELAVLAPPGCARRVLFLYVLFRFGLLGGWDGIGAWGFCLDYWVGYMWHCTFWGFALVVRVGRAVRDADDINTQG